MRGSLPPVSTSRWISIVGGPAGIRVAREPIDNGARVWLLDCGGKDMEGRAQRQNRGQSVGYPIHRPHQSRVRAFGGTTWHWVAPGDETWATRPWTRSTSRSGPRSATPVCHSTVPTWTLPSPGQGLCQLGPFDYGPGRWADQTRTRALPLPPGAVETTLFQNGTASFEGYYQELVRAPNATLLLHASVVDLATGEDPGRVDRVEVRRDDGSRCSVRARLVALAAGGIENPRLLLLSRRIHRRGLGNDRELVGRFFAERTSARSGYVVPATPNSLAAPVCTPSMRPRQASGCRGRCGVRAPAQRERPLLSGAIFLLTRNLYMTAEAVRSVAALAKPRRCRSRRQGRSGTCATSPPAPRLMSARRDRR